MVFFVFNLILRYEQSVGTKQYLDKLDFLTMEILLEVYIKSDPDIRLQQPTILYNHQIGHMLCRDFVTSSQLLQFSNTT